MSFLQVTSASPHPQFSPKHLALELQAHSDADEPGLDNAVVISPSSAGYIWVGG